MSNADEQLPTSSKPVNDELISAHRSNIICGIYNTRRKEKQNIYLRGDRRKPRELKKLLKKETANSSKNLLEIFQTWSLVERGAVATWSCRKRHS